MANYYNEFDPFAAEWIRELIRAGLIPDGDVDERSIKEVQPDDLKDYTQCHFFCGIGGWPEALRIARWPSSRPCWSGSVPCQSFSTAGKQKGVNDERHLWPEFFRLIAACRPSVVFGEQVDGAIRHGWLDLVSDDLGGVGYELASAIIPAAGVGSPHIRSRLFWVAKNDRK